MEVIFEVVNRAGRTLERYRRSGERLTIGRAFDNDITLSDETVSPHHAVLESRGEAGIVLTDLNSLNGIHSGSMGRVKGVIDFVSGHEYSLGRAQVRIYKLDHPVAETMRIGGTDGIINSLGSSQGLSAIICLAAVVAVGEQWLNTYARVVWQEIAIGVFSVIAVGLLFAAFWAILGRVIKHEGRFQSQFALVMAYLLLQSAIVWLYEVVLFNSLNRLLSATFFLTLSFALLSCLLWLCLSLATHLISSQRWKYSTSIAAVMLSISIYPEILQQTEFADSPEYIKEVKSPTLRFTDGATVDQFLERSSKLYKETNHDGSR